MNVFDMTIIRESKPYVHVPHIPFPIMWKWIKVKAEFRGQPATHVTFYLEVFGHCDHLTLSNHFREKYPQATYIRIEEVAE